jgi:hypothetical protein
MVMPPSNRHYTVTETFSTRGTMATPPCFCQQNCICKKMYPRRVRQELWQNMLKRRESYFTEICHVLLINRRSVLFRVNCYFIHTYPRCQDNWSILLVASIFFHLSVHYLQIYSLVLAPNIMSIITCIVLVLLHTLIAIPLAPYRVWSFSAHFTSPSWCRPGTDAAALLFEAFLRKLVHS